MLQNDDTYNLYEIKISVLDGYGRHATMTTNDGKILGREKPISKYPYKDKMAERRLSEQKVPFQDTMTPNLVTTDQSVNKTRTQTTTMTSCSPRQKGSAKYILNRMQQITMASF